MSELNPQQQAIVDAPIDGAYRILAGPGSGKTHTLVQRIKHLIDSGVKPQNILAVTFSKNMAQELYDRLVPVCPSITSENTCTIHALCYRILKEEGEHRKVVPFGVMKKFANEAIDYAGITEAGWADFLSYVGAAKFNAIRHNKLASFYQHRIEQNGGGINAEWKDEAPARLRDAHIFFDQLLQDSNYLTYPDMLVEVEWLFQDRLATLKKYQNRFKYIFVDEAQDTSTQAMRILTLLAAPEDNFNAIGDTDQTIFEFAGANPEANLWSGFERRFPEHTTFKLEINYRSTKKIIDFTNKAIEANYNPENEQYRKFIQPPEEYQDGKEITYEVFNTVYDEAEAIVNKLRDIAWDDHMDYGDFFICARTRAQLPYFYGLLAKQSVPFVDKCGGSFWESAHVQDLIAYMRLTVDRTDQDAFMRIFNKATIYMKQPFDLKDKKTGKVIRARGEYVNHRWLGKEFIDECQGKYSNIYSINNRRFADGIADLTRFMQQLDEVIKAGGNSAAGPLARHIVQYCLSRWWAMESGSKDETVSDGDGRGQDFNSVIDIADHLGSVEEFLAYVDEMVKLAAQSNYMDDSKVVVLSTIHRLKGLERKVVFVTGVMEGLLPHFSINGMPKTDGVLPFKFDNTAEAERRLFFVAVSRPKLQLYLTGSWQYQRKTLMKSRFAYETGLVQEELANLADSLLDDEMGNFLEE